MAYRPKFTTRHRDYLYSEARAAAGLAGRGEHPICPICDAPVFGDIEPWDEVHVTVPRCFGGKSKTVGHRRCNQLENNTTVTPAFAKAERVRKRHLGITGPGLGRHPMPCGRRSSLRKTMTGEVLPRPNPGQAHRDFVRRRRFVEVEDFSEPLEVQP